jgi:peptidoglycan/xylan/chitin deacetylase (PgdA/CDA1 family)
MEMFGRTLGNYRIEALLGSGRLGRVYRATHGSLERPAALRIFHERLAADPAFREQLLHRAAELVMLRHPHLVEIYDAGEADGLLYLAMEYCAGGSIGRLVREAAGSGEPVPLETSLDLIDQATEGLEYAHSQGCVHGAITPNNLLLASENGRQRLKIGDIGLSALGDGVAGGSRAYRSPEQLRGLEPDERSDVYALGAVLYQLVTGRLPFGAHDHGAANQPVADPPSPRDLNPELPRPLEEVILRCLAPRPENRYGSAAKLGIALRTLSSSSPAHDAAVSELPLPPLTSQYVPRAAVRLIARDHRVALAPGETRQLRVTVENAGTATDEFLVAIEPSPIVQTEELPRRVRLDAEQQELVTLAVTLDRESRVVPGEYRLRILAHAAMSETVNDTAFAAAVILPERPGPLTIRQMGASSGGQREFQLDLFNEGGTTAHYTLAASDPEHLLNYRFNADIVTVEPGRSRTIVLSVRDRRRRPDGAPVQFLVVATPARGEPISATANFNRPVGTGRRLLPLLSGLAAVLAVILIGTILALHVSGSDGNNINAQARSTGAATSGAAVIPAATPTAAPSPTPAATPTAIATATPAATPTPSTQTPLTVRQVTTEKKAVALTFSLASNDETAAKLQAILAVLKQSNIHATFGFRGDWAEAHPDLVKEIVADGHQLVNATYDYQSFTGESTQSGPLSSSAIIEELTRDAQVIKQITGVDMAPYYRPPYGDTDTGNSTAVADAAAKAGYSVSVLWSIDTESWAEGRTVADMVASANKAEPGDIILFNITKAGGNKDVDSLPQIIRDLGDKGFQFATVKELVGR